MSVTSPKKFMIFGVNLLCLKIPLVLSLFMKKKNLILTHPLTYLWVSLAALHLHAARA